MTNSNQRVNVAQKPLLQLEFLLRVCNQDRGSVVDLFCGSGSGVVAALRMGFSAIGIDSSDDQLQATVSRAQEFGRREVSTSQFVNCVVAVVCRVKSPVHPSDT